MHTPRPERPPASRLRRVMSSVFAVLCGMLALVLFFFGGLFLLVGHEDYSEYTGRTEAVVNAVEPVAGSTDSTTVYVDYQVDGRQYTRTPLHGTVPDLSDGDRLPVAYDPAGPGGEVATVASAEETAYDLFFWLGVALWCLSGVAAVSMVVLFAKAIRGPAKRTGAAG